MDFVDIYITTSNFFFHKKHFFSFLEFVQYEYLQYIMGEMALDCKSFSIFYSIK